MQESDLIGTPRGRNSFFELWRRSQTEDGWLSLMLKASETGLIPQASLHSRAAISARDRAQARRQGRRSDIQAIKEVLDRIDGKPRPGDAEQAPRRVSIRWKDATSAS